MSHFGRFSRGAVLAACLPYLLVSVFVDFAHVHRQASPVVYADGAPSLTEPGTAPTSQPDRTCTACLWLQAGVRLVSRAAAGPAPQTAAADFILPAETIWPASPVPTPASFRGPPPSLLG